MQLHQFLNQREANAAAFIGAVLLPFDPVEALKQARQFRLGDADAGIANCQFRLPAVGSQADRDFALEGEFEGVGEEVEDDLLPHVPVDIDGLGKRRTIHDKRQPGAFAGGAEIAGQLRR